MRKMIRGVSILLIGVLLMTGAASGLAEDASEINEALAKYFKSYKTTGAVVVVAKNNEIVHHYDYGYAYKKDKTPVTPETYFRSASVTKLISAIGVMQLVEQGKLALDAPIGDYLGIPIVNPHFRNIPITLRHLMTHTSSISQKGGYGSRRPLDQYLDASLNRWANWTEDRPGSKYAYSNFGAGLMGSLMESATGKNINDVLTEGVFAPLGMDAAYHVKLLQEPEKAATIYNTDGTIFKSISKCMEEKWEEEPDPMSHYDITVGDVWIRGDDLCRLGMMLCNGGTVDGVTILQPETVAAMMESQKGLGYVTVDSPYGLCVNRVTSLVEGTMIYGHQGMSAGILCNLYWDPETDFVFAMISNGCSNNLDNRIAKLARRVFGVMWDAYSGK